jgi:hemerythrin-like domain-containing protein
MQARGLLMIEHRLIERMIAIIKNTLVNMESDREIDPVLVDNVVDFIRIYADRTHHGKEEDILFKKMRERSLSADDERDMNELIEGHVFGRKTTRALAAANERYRGGDMSALADIESSMRALVGFYPGHIEKEDKVFFPSARSYFTDDEDQTMLSEFYAFDRKMIHEKYESVVSEIEKKITA